MKLKLLGSDEVSSPAVARPCGVTQVYVQLRGLVDFDVEIKKLKKQVIPRDIPKSR